MIVPDLHFLASEYMQAQSSGGAQAAADRLMDALACCPSLDKGVWLVRKLRAGKQFNVHKGMYDEVSLGARMHYVGFTDVRRRGLMESQMPQVRTVERDISFVHGVCVEGVKA